MVDAKWVTVAIWLLVLYAVTRDNMRLLSYVVLANQQELWAFSNASHLPAKADDDDDRTNSGERGENQRLIQYQLHHDRPYPKSENVRPYSCPLSSDQGRIHFPESPPGTWDFSTHIETDLNILFIGDSISHQISMSFERACGARRHVRLRKFQWKKTQADAITIALNINGGGIVAFWRMLGVWSPNNLDKPGPNSGHGWFPYHLEALQNRTRQGQRNATRRSRAGYPAYDVLVHRLNHPWIKSVTSEDLQDVVKLAEQHFNTKVVVFMTAHYNNNILTPKDLDELREMNEVVQEFAASFSPTSRDEWGVQHVVVADVGHYVDEAIKYNGEKIGYNVSCGDSIYFEKLRRRKPNDKFARSIPMVCAKKMTPNSVSCPKNDLFNDGLHFCMERLGHRIYGVLACLMGCAYNKQEANSKECESACNTKFMSVLPVEQSEVQ